MIIVVKRALFQIVMFIFICLIYYIYFFNWISHLSHRTDWLARSRPSRATVFDPVRAVQPPACFRLRHRPRLRAPSWWNLPSWTPRSGSTFGWLGASKQLRATRLLFAVPLNPPLPPCLPLLSLSLAATALLAACSCSTAAPVAPRRAPPASRSSPSCSRWPSTAARPASVRRARPHMSSARASWQMMSRWQCPRRRPLSSTCQKLRPPSWPATPPLTHSVGRHASAVPRKGCVHWAPWRPWWCYAHWQRHNGIRGDRFVFCSCFYFQTVCFFLFMHLSFLFSLIFILF